MGHDVVACFPLEETRNFVGPQMGVISPSRRVVLCDNRCGSSFHDVVFVFSEFTHCHGDRGPGREGFHVD